ncbi:MAG: hypothetical protein IPN83_01725 [Holophagales bacterium]|nr:hypothetical protein [Holophagales bacterium]
MSDETFHLTKWYLDAVSEDGRVLVGHHGELSWKGISFRHASVLLRDRAGQVTERWASRGISAPVLEEGSVRWTSLRPAVDGLWKRAEGGAGNAESGSFRLLATAEGSVDWSCLVPAARVRATLPDGSLLEGSGYAEKLELSIPPWRLPIEELRWGRFLSGGSSLVWIDWRGAVPLSLALLDGRRVAVVSIDDTSVVLADPPGRLDLLPTAVLRDGLLGGPVLGRVPGLSRTLPARMLRVHESRRLARGVLEVEGGVRREGDALFEVVRWP